jgi:transposase
MKQALGNPGFVGVDVASAHLDIAEQGRTAVQRIGNAEGAILAWLKGVGPGTVLALESTGRYHLTLARLAHAHGLRVYVLNARDVKHYARGVGQRGKTDRLDAQLLARYIAHEHTELHAWQPPPPEVQRLDELLRHRAVVVRHKTALRQSLGHDSAMARLLRSLMQPLDKALKTLDTQIRAAVMAVPQGAAGLQRITSVPGVGLLSGAALLRLFTRLGPVSADSVIAFTGLDPRPMDSGNKRGLRRLSKRGPAELRRLLYNAAMSASRTAAWRAVYERELAKGLPRTAALVVLARKLVRVAFSLFKSESLFDPQHSGGAGQT